MIGFNTYNTYDGESIRRAIAERLYRSVFPTKEEAYAAVSVEYRIECDDMVTKIKVGGLVEQFGTRDEWSFADFLHRVWAQGMNS